MSIPANSCALISRSRRLAVMTAALSLLIAGSPASAQQARGELRLRVTDPKGGGVIASVELVSAINQVRRNFWTDSAGHSVAAELPFGVYRLRVSRQGFVPVDRLIEIRSEVPLNLSITLGLPPVESRVNVSDSATLVDPERTGTVYSLGSQAIKEEMPAQLGRGLLELVDSEPGWLFEANGVLHPRGSEYDVQFVTDGLPVTENQSPAFAPPLESADVDSMRILTARPARDGRGRRWQLFHGRRISGPYVCEGREPTHADGKRGRYRSIPGSARSRQLYQSGL